MKISGVLAIGVIIAGIILSNSFLFHNYLFAGIPPGDGNSGADALNYRFDYTFLGQARGVFLMVFRYRFFLCANASVLLKARNIGGHRLEFNYAGIDSPGCLMRTTGFSGKGLITAAAHLDLQKNEPILANDLDLFKKKAGDYARFIKRRNVFSFQLLPRANSALSFKRDLNGIHHEGSIHLDAQPVKNKKKVDFFFKIYPMLLEMIMIYDHPFHQGDWQTISQLQPGQQWFSRNLDYSKAMNRLSACTTKLAKKYVKFKQKYTFKLLYRVTSRTSDCLTIEGRADPRVVAWAKFKIMKVIRTIRLRIPDGVVMLDKVYAEIYKREGNGGIVQCALALED